MYNGWFYIAYFLYDHDKRGLDDKRGMTYNELHDLRSKIMLVAGETDEGGAIKKYFVDTLAKVEALTRAYVDLRESGCLLFQNWTIDIRY